MMKLFYAETAQMIAIAEEEELIQKRISGQIEQEKESDSESASGSES
jgi:hypothetical protein